MPDTDEIRSKARIVAAVRLKREVLEGVIRQTDLHALVAKYARVSLFTDNQAQAVRLREQIKSAMRKKYFPAAEASGYKSAGPVLESLGKPGNPSLSGPSLRFLTKYKKANLRWFAAEIETGFKTLSGEVQAAFARAQRDGIGRRTLLKQLTDSTKEEMAALAKKRRLLARVNREYAKAESTGKLRLIREARKARAKARAAVNRVTTALGRFENKVQGAARDAVRREAQRAQLAAYRQSGYRVYTWVTVNGSAACPDCSSLHGETRSIRDWHGMQPGDGHTYCGDSCMCELAPEDFCRDNEQITGPINPYLEL